MFGSQTSSPLFGTPSTIPSFGNSSPLFSTPATSTTLFETPPGFGAPSSASYTTGLGTGIGLQHPNPFPHNGHLITQMAPVAPLPLSPADRHIQVILDAYKDETGNSKYAFKHLLFSVTEPQFRAKPNGVSDIMWAEAMGKLEGMDSSNRERLWPQLIQGFKDLSQRLKLQDEVIISDSERLRMTQNNVKLLQRHFQTDTFPRIQRLKLQEQALQRRLLRVMRIVEALENKGCRLPLMKGEAELAEKLVAITRQMKGSGSELSMRVQNLLSVTRVQANGNSGGSSYLPGSTVIQEQSFVDMQEVLQQQTEAIGRLSNVLKRDIRDMQIMSSNDIQ